MATYAIGDIQGCMSALVRLLEQIRFTPNKDRLWLVGDLVNRGPDSLSVLRYVRSLGTSAITVLGNHDLHLLGVGCGVARTGKKDTLQDVLAAPDRDDLLAWLRRQPLVHQEGGFGLVHAGLLPQWSMDTAAQLAREVEEILRSDGYPELLRKIYDGTAPHRWSDNLTGINRSALALNVLTKLRVCTVEGEMDPAFKSVPSDAPPGLFPWFAIPSRRNADSTIIFGHWSALGLHVQDNIMALDTGCVWGRHLTAIRLQDRHIFQAQCVE